ncbi:deoxyuridine 5'-triphosphate nucleotidohydrolase [Methanocaldococcus indicus]|uniref:deoxyuridine 5'-triphosphate nucleotidohydrolase n=1 Tax=Methanocaldococcus indicus TaxID=213231 RepID=UPI003C6D9373
MIVSIDEIKNFFKNLDNKQVQQCGVDLRVWKIFEIEDGGEIDFTNEKRKLPNYKEIFNSEKDDYILLKRGEYLVKVYDYLKIPQNVAGFVYPRSSLLRMGATIYSAVHDPGYEGYPEYLLKVYRDIKIHKFARICQIVFVRCEKSNIYNGIYKGK